MKKISLVLMLAAGLSLTFSCDDKPKEQQGETVDAAEEKNDSTLTNDDSKDNAEFLVQAANGGLLEVEAGKLAKEKASAKSVKDYADHMVADHTKANDELKAYAAKHNIALPDSVDKDYQDQLETLREKTGKEFDAEYISLMVKDHKKDVSLFEDASEDVSDPELKALVDKTLPTLRHHLEMAQAADSLMQARK